MTRTQELLDTARRVQLPNYRPAPMVLVKGEGCRVTDEDGKRYLDLSAGIAVTSVGHAHPKLAAAIAAQAARLLHVSNLFYNDRAIELSAELVKRTAFDRVYFCNSGAEANETLLKLARRHHHEQGHSERRKLVATIDSFHGRTMGSLSLTGQPKYHAGMEPLVGDIEHVPYNDLDAMRAAVDDRTAAVLVEPLQAEGGLNVPADGYLQGLRDLCDERGALLMFDEVQTGYGRTGPFLGAENWGVVADACSLAKGIAGGFPLGAVLVRESLAGGLPPGSHASTFGGNALACAAGLAVLQIFDEEGVLDNVTERATQLSSRCADFVQRFSAVTEARGKGLLQGVVFAQGVDPAATLALLRERGVLATLAGGTVLRLSPALNVSEAELDEGLNVVAQVLQEVSP